MSLERLADLLHSRGLTWRLQVTSGRAESTVTKASGAPVYFVAATSVETAIARTIAALGAADGLHVKPGEP